MKRLLLVLFIVPFIHSQTVRDDWGWLYQTVDTNVWEYNLEFYQSPLIESDEVEYQYIIPVSEMPFPPGFMDDSTPEKQEWNAKVIWLINDDNRKFKSYYWQIK